MIILPKPGENMGGLLRMYCLPASSVASLSRGVLSLLSKDDVISVYITPESSHADCQLKRSAAGHYYELSVGGFTPRLREEAQRLFELMAGRSYLVVIRDGNGQYQLAGTTEEPLRFSFSARTGSAVTDRNGYDLLFERSCKAMLQQIHDPFQG
jgi:hypothetical protein